MKTAYIITYRLEDGNIGTIYCPSLRELIQELREFTTDWPTGKDLEEGYEAVNVTTITL